MTVPAQGTTPSGETPQLDRQALRAHVMEFIELSADAIISTDAHQRITLFNRAAQTLFGYSAEEAMGLPLARLVSAPFVEGTEPAQAAADEQTQPASTDEGRLFVRGWRKDGSEFPAEASMLESDLADQFRYTVTLRSIEARLQAEAALRESEKTEHELQIAHNIQAGFLPGVLPEHDGWEIAARFYPARKVAGDFYDAFFMSGKRRIGFLLGDVVDKGVPAALFMSLCRSLLRAFAQQHYSLAASSILDELSAADRHPHPGEDRVLSTGTLALKNAVGLTNDYILDNHVELNMFATLFFGMFDPANGQLAYINAGHNPPFLVSRDGEIKAKLKPTGPAVGMFPNVDFTIAATQFAPGDVLYVYSDGVPEARDESGAFYGESRLLAELTVPTTSANELVERVDASLQAFVGSAVQFDDITMMAVRHEQVDGDR